MTRSWLSLLTTLALLVQAAFAAPAADRQTMTPEVLALASLCSHQHKPSKPASGCAHQHCWLCQAHAGPIVLPASVATPVAFAQQAGLFAAPRAGFTVHSTYTAYSPRGPPRRV